MEETTEGVTSALEAARSSVLAQDAPSFALHCKELIKALGQVGEHASRVLHCHEGRGPVAAERSLVAGGIVLTADVFGFCKEVDVDHRWALDGFSDLLGTMFKANMNLLRLLFDSLDKALPSQEHKDRRVVVSLRGLCVQVLNFDTTLVLHAWRALVRELGKCKAALGQEEEEAANDVLQVPGLAQDLCTATVVTYGKCLELATSGSQEFQRLLKSCKHLLSLLMVLLRDVDDGSGDTLPYYQVLLKLFSEVPPSLTGCHIPSGPLQSISTALLSVSEPMLQLMVARKCFAQQLLSKDVPQSGQGYAWCLCLVKVMGMFERVPGGLQESHYLFPASSLETTPQGCPLLEAVFECVKFCHAELALSIPSLPGSSLSLYQSLCTNLSAFLAQLNPEHWSNVEATLFRHALCGEPNCSALAADVWSFLWRWGTADLCRLNAFLLAHTVLSLPPGPSLQCHALTRLAARAVAFMAVEHKSGFIEAFAPAVSDHLQLWSALSLHHFSANQQKQVIGQLVVLASSCVERAVGGQTDDYKDLYNALRALCRVYELPKGACGVEPVAHSKLMALMPKLWEWSLLIRDLESSRVAQALVSALMQFTSLALPSLPVHDAGKVLSCASHLAHTSRCPAVLLSATSLLSACHQVAVPPGQETLCLAPLSALSRLLLTSTHWLVKHRALEAFRVFAQNTPYGRVAEQCIPEQLSEEVVDYLNQVPFGVRDSPSALGQKQVAQRVQVRYRGLEEKLVAGSSVDSNVVDLTEDCTAGADEVIGLPPGLGSDGTSETTSFDSGLRLMVDGWQAVQEASWEGRDLSGLNKLQLSMAQQLEKRCCSLQLDLT